MDIGKYKSPISKVVSFLEKSRDNWKTKYSELMKRTRRLENQVRAVEASREKWRREANQARAELKQVKKTLRPKASTAC